MRIIKLKKKIYMILKLKKIKLSKQRTCMCIEIGESKTDCFPLYYLKWFNVLVISVAPNYTKPYPSIAVLLVRSQLLFIFVSERPITSSECCKSDKSIVKPSWLAERLLMLKWIVEKKGTDLIWEISSRINSFYYNFPCVFVFCLKNARNFYTLAAKILF